MNENIAALREAIRLKDSPMRVSHMRLNTRSMRPNIELVRDPVQYGLVEEVGQITDSVEALSVSFRAGLEPSMTQYILGFSHLYLK